jgi:hypothetical protein
MGTSACSSTCFNQVPSQHFLLVSGSELLDHESGVDDRGPRYEPDREFDDQRPANCATG